MYQGRACQQAAAEVAWPRRYVVENPLEAEMVAKQELVCVKEELQSERETWLASSVRASGVASE